MEVPPGATGSHGDGPTWEAEQVSSVTFPVVLAVSATMGRGPLSTCIKQMHLVQNWATKNRLDVSNTSDIRVGQFLKTSKPENGSPFKNMGMQIRYRSNLKVP